MKKIKTRFAPSPTGYLHLGSIRTALYSWLVARKYNGKFILRIEDSDHKRFVYKAVETIIDSMNWLNLNWDDELYFQSKRLDLYHEIIDRMLKEGTAYKCYCSRSRLEKLRREQISKGNKPKYDGYCRRNYRGFLKESLYVVRFANPEKGRVVFNDQIRGPIVFNNEELDDLIICRADGSPTYNFCAAIDDWDMSITHVIRGDDHINNTPRQINILKALNAPIPIYAHLSMINDKDGKRLSKRHGAMSIMQYREEGYLPEALLNYLLRLGWSHENQEVFSREEMIEFFSLKKVNKSTSTFNKDKLLWLNHRYINILPIKKIVTHLQWYIKRENFSTKDGPPLSELIRLLGRRCKTLKEIIGSCHYFYKEFSKFDEKAAEEYLNLAAYKPLEIVRDKILEINNWTIENVRLAIQVSSFELKVHMKEVGMPLRVAVTGTSRSPALDLTVHAIGKNRCISRINKALSYIIKCCR